MADQHSTLRARRRAQTQRMIQGHAVRLFAERGYDATTVNDVAEAAGVSPMTVYRHFPTKEDLVLVDQRGELVAERIAASPVEQLLARRIGDALVDAAAALTGDDDGRAFLLTRLRLMVSTPALRARHLDNQYALQQAIIDALGADTADPEAAFRAEAAAGACLSALHTALVRWAQDDGRGELPGLVTKALTAVFGQEVFGGEGVSGEATASR
ncbi:TetR-family transcriptional regulator [[Actinomadura] parvosata subsp. kistnae]|uniref:TetR family transcriptional regulator n=1 Tax=[Actinomadura] parvosata subsp. kistnae TaxID=1909395 RepID=A0A1V0A0N4_9ACTN|nr:TetR/AcrR family transcriptional regulator [Nonomuraea sp. ATCC 55076]AQZ63753.1 TetR family transcriptional regulator [Nonomuraea sp. ATCC 55076]SPL89557.1 TetR-family transcriptional regulator [Actinomadura parvosata subsp. kistnae]